jgi:putative ABC transport system permease protein
MYGSMSFANYTVAGVARFGTSVLDRGAIILDISDARLLLDMDNAASEVFGFMSKYDINKAESIKNTFNAKYEGDSDEYAPLMLQLADQNSMRSTIAYVSSIMLIMVVLLVFALSIVLWNTGVLGGIRRYNEFGVRLALGEEKKHIYGSLLGESLIIGIIGSCLGTALGLTISFYVKTYGIDYGSVMDNISMMMDPVIRSDIKPRMYFIGFIPGVISMLIGSALAGIAIYRRKTAVLFKELG